MNQLIDRKTSPARQPLWLTILRVFLGLILFWKAINFIRDTARLKSLIEQTGVGVFTKNADVLASVVAYLTLLCGFFIVVGLFTRLAAIVQIPVLIVAVFFVNLKSAQFDLFEFVLSIIALGLLLLFSFKGSGFLSADEYFRQGAAYDRAHQNDLR